MSLLRPPAIARLFLLVLLATLLPGCAANSEGRYRGMPIDEQSALVRYVLASIEGEPTDAALEREALLQLEDIVEEAASRVSGESMDYPSPELGEFDFIVEVDRRGSEEFEEFFYEAFYDGDLGMGAKYLFDHAGDAGFEAVDHEDAPELCEWIDEYSIGLSKREEVEPHVRELEALIRADLGIGEEEWWRNEQRFDAAVDALGAYTEPFAGCPLFTHCRVELPRGLFVTSLRELVKTYAHELLHCRIGDLGAETEDRRILEEISCEVFGAHVADALEPSGIFRFDPVLEVVAAGAAPPTADPSHEPLREDEIAELETWFTRLGELYRTPEMRFEAWRKTQERYGYLDVKSGAGPPIYEQVDLVMRRMALADYVRLLHDVEDLADLEAVFHAATKAQRLAPSDAETALRAARAVR